MTALTTTFAKTAFLTRVGAVLEEMFRRRQVRKTARALRALSDAGLKDIGLHRSEVDSVAAAGQVRRR